MKIGGFQKCKIHSPSIKAFRIIACQSWCISLVFFQAEDGIRDQPRSRGLGDVYKRQGYAPTLTSCNSETLDARRMYFTFLETFNFH